METRTTNVQQLKLDSLAYSSILQIGDTSFTEPSVNVIAVQKEGGISSDKSFSFEDDSFFQQSIPFLPNYSLTYGDHHMLCPRIDIHSLDVSAASSSAVIQLGNSQHVHSIARLKHIRIVDPD
ncbi:MULTISPECIES: spore germination protein GerPE [Gracilibacillus]|uniref:spore germination protein GerPE n=1 Tax=Gracilibacillus TaxID=74385 RepID=UPI0008258396|nr:MULTISPECIES: spore germination protein GerPE [Gracilibacillus]